MKAYTDLEQSKKLAEILPLESADMWWNWFSDPFDGVNGGEYTTEPLLHKPVCYPEKVIPCWSLAALLDILRNRAPSIDEDANVSLFSYRTVEWWDLTICNSVIEPVTKSDPIDACVEMILKLKENNLL